MAKLAYEISNYARSDGSRAVTIRVSHRNRSRHMPTNVIAWPEDLTRDGRIRSRTLKDKLDELIRQLYKVIERISYYDLHRCNVDYIVARLKAASQQDDFKLDFFTFAGGFINNINNPATQKTYKVAVEALRHYLTSLGKVNLDINDITTSILSDFVYFINSEHKQHFSKNTSVTDETKISKKHGTSAKAYLSKLSAIFNAAKNKYNDEDMGTIRIPRSPFSKVKVKASPSRGQKALSLDLMRRIVSTDARNEVERAALDIFIVSFCLMGANLADLFEAEPPVKGIWTYFRKKTRDRREDRAEMHVRIPECLTPYLERLTTHCDKGKWLNLSHRYSGIASANKTINQILKGWAIRHGVKPFTFYAARKSWATIARSRACRIDKALVDECLAHVGDYRLTDIYAERDWETIWAANNKVLNVVFNDA